MTLLRFLNMNFKTLKAFSLLELIVVIFIGSSIIVYSTIFSKEYYEAEYKNQEMAILKLDLDSAKIIVEKNLPSSVNKLKYENNKLYLKDSLLLDKVTYFTKQKTSNSLEITIVLDKRIKQNWKFSL